MMKSTALFCLALSLVTASAQLVRQANTTLSLPSSLPSPSGYVVENAIGTICLRTLPGVTNTLFVVERGGTIQKVNMGGNIHLIVPEILGRSGVVETTTDFQNWLPLNHPNNTPKFPANSGTKTLVFPMDSARRFPRLRIESL